MTSQDNSQNGKTEADIKRLVEERVKAENEMLRQVQERVAEARTAVGSGKDDSDGKPSSKLIQECLFANVLGDAVLFATLNRDRFVYRKNAQEWYEFNGHHWSRDGMGKTLIAVESTVVDSYLEEYRRISGKISDLAKDENTDGKVDSLKKIQKKLLKRVELLRDERRRNACLTFAHTIEHPLAVVGDEFDRDPWLLACANGVINLKSGALWPGRSGDYISLASPVEWKGIDEPAPLWERSLLQIFNDDADIVAYINRLFGYGITGLVTEKVFPVLWGKHGWNGRSTIVDTISYVLGSLAGAIPAEMLLSSKYAKSSSSPSPDIMTLKGLRLAFASETDEGNRFSASKVKWLTGKDEFVGRSPHDKYFSRFQPTHKTVLMTNTQPQAPANDHSFWERLHLIPFMISFINREPQDIHERRAILDLDEQLRKEAPGILAWLVRGCIFWQKYGLAPPRKITEATEQYRQNEDLLADFIDECCLIEPGAKERAANLYQRFTGWYEANVGKKVPTGHWFGKQLSQKYEKGKIGGMIYYFGIAIYD